MKNCTEEYMLVTNLYNTAIAHKKNCKENCNVSLLQLRFAAQKIWRIRELLGIVDIIENKEIKKMIENWPY